MGERTRKRAERAERVRNYYSSLVVIISDTFVVPLVGFFLSFSGTHRDRFLVAWLFLSFLYLVVLSQREKKSCFFAQKFLKFL